MIDWTRISELREEVGADDLSEVLDLFFDEVGEAVAALGQCAESELSVKLHFLKGSAMNIGLTRVSELCLEAERQLANDSPGPLGLSEIKIAFEDAKLELKATDIGSSRPASSVA